MLNLYLFLLFAKGNRLNCCFYSLSSKCGVIFPVTSRYSTKYVTFEKDGNAIDYVINFYVSRDGGAADSLSVKKDNLLIKRQTSLLSAVTI